MKILTWFKKIRCEMFHRSDWEMVNKSFNNWQCAKCGRKWSPYE